VALRNIAVKTAADQQGLNTQDPTTGYRSARRLEPREGQTEEAKNWIAMSPEVKPREEAKKEEGQAKEEGKDEEKKDEEKKSAKQRLIELQEAYDAGLITEEEYQRKRDEIINGI
jgi:hypothetical protein